MSGALSRCATVPPGQHATGRQRALASVNRACTVARGSVSAHKDVASAKAPILFVDYDHHCSDGRLWLFLVELDYRNRPSCDNSKFVILKYFIMHIKRTSYLNEIASLDGKVHNDRLTIQIARIGANPTVI